MYYAFKVKGHNLIISEEEDQRLPDDARLHEELSNVIAPFGLAVHSRYFYLLTYSDIFSVVNSYKMV